MSKLKPIGGISLHKLMEEDGRAKRALCPTCGLWVAVSAMPLAEMERDTIKIFKEYALRGFKIDIVSRGEIGRGCGGHVKPIFHQEEQ